MVYRKCGLGDLEKLQELSKTTFSNAFEEDNNPEDFHIYLEKAFSSQQLKKELKNPNSEFYFALVDDAIMGYLKINFNDAQSELREPYGAELERIYVISSFQGKGLGQDMLLQAEKLIQRKGKNYLWLGVWEHNRNAIRFYERYGYEKFDTHPYYIGKDKQTDWLLKKEFK